MRVSFNASINNLTEYISWVVLPFRSGIDIRVFPTISQVKAYKN